MTELCHIREMPAGDLYEYGISGTQPTRETADGSGAGP